MAADVEALVTDAMLRPPGAFQLQVGEGHGCICTRRGPELGSRTGRRGARRHVGLYAGAGTADDQERFPKCWAH